jgi:hypothetical protein
MPVCLLCPDRLTTLDDVSHCCVALEVTDQRDDYCSEDGDGVWIRAYLEFLEAIVCERCCLPNFSFSDYEGIAQALLEEIDEPYTRNLIIAFTNEHYESWRDDDVSLPDYDEVRSDCRDFCSDCDSGWTDIHGEYDGPLADDVEDDEDEDESGITEEERAARQRRNEERESERERRRRGQEDAESEIVDREFTCDESCDSFYDHVSDVFRERVELNVRTLRKRWDDFLEEAGEAVMPELHFAPRSLARQA